MADNQSAAAAPEETVEKMDTAPAAENAATPAAQPETAAPAAAAAEPENNENTGVIAPGNTNPANALGNGQIGNIQARTTSTVPTRQYLDSTVVPILLQALGALAKDRPENPIEFLANFLLREKDRYNVEQPAQQA
uniref:Uncharacterized protein n=1 Tax=Caenorhabditis japonica TaxID=281687 RepID=A0A8R1DXV2_CAEJA